MSESAKSLGLTVHRIPLFLWQSPCSLFFLLMKNYLSNFHGEKTKGTSLFCQFQELYNEGKLRKMLIPIRRI